VFASSVLLIVLLASGFGRVLGFNAWVDSTFEKWQMAQREKKRDSVYNARRDLENKWEEDDRDAGS
jgi:hypothetical protein